MNANTTSSSAIPPFSVPEPVGRLMSLLPPYPGSLLFVAALNAVVRDRLPADVRAMLVGRRLRIRVTDARVAFDFRGEERGFVACPANGTPDLTIAASTRDFLLLARRQEDPDTLFFSRRLSMEGDTELGLLVKNTLDAIDLPVFELGRAAPGRLFSRLGARLRAGLPR